MIVDGVDVQKLVRYCDALQTLLNIVVANLPEEVTQSIIRDVNLFGQRLEADGAAGAEEFREIAAELVLALSEDTAREM